MEKQLFETIRVGQYFLYDGCLWVRTCGNNAITEDLRSFYFSHDFGVVPVDRPFLELREVNIFIFGK